MSKYYVECGSQSLVTTASCAQHAAMRLIDEAFGTHVWIYEDEQLTEQERRDHLVLEALLHLGTSVSVSERGHGRTDAGTFEVPELIDQWHKLMTGLSKMFSDVGLAHRRVLPEFTDDCSDPKLPR